MASLFSASPTLRSLRSLLLWMLFPFLLSCQSREFDLLIVNGKIYDGANKRKTGTVIGIQDDKITYVGDYKKAFAANRTIDATGLIVCPGFIDPHTHADRDLIDSNKSHNRPFVYQGVTTVVVGNDGNSFFPTEDYIRLYRSHGIGTNVVMLAGHGTLREQVLGMHDRRPTAQELDTMKQLLAQELEAGAFGISTGLYYAPGSYASTEEVIELAHIVKKYDGIYDTHLRDESTFSIGIINAVEEAIRICHEAKIPLHISHIKCLGIDVWNQSDSIINLIEYWRQKGLDVTANQYPYEASSTSLKAAVVPRWGEAGGLDSLFRRLNHSGHRSKLLNDTKRNIIRRGGPDKLLIVHCQDTSYTGKTLAQIAAEKQKTPEECVYMLLKTGITKVASFNMNPADINNFMQKEWVVTGSDGNEGHPRKYGSFPRKYRKFVTETQLIDLETFIESSSTKTAHIFDIPLRGSIRKDYFADIIIFDPHEYSDVANFRQPHLLSKGLKYSIINGHIVVDDGRFSERLAGRILLK